MEAVSDKAWIAIGLFLAILLPILVGLFLTLNYMRFLDRLRLNHPAKWCELGGPFWNRVLFPGDGWSFKTSAFIVAGQYRTLHDVELNRFGDRLRALYVGSFCVFLVFGVFLFFGARS